jgi:hypothetical protein
VEAKEKRKDARLAREIELALQTEFDLREQIELLREYVKENFVDKGMIVDFAMHHNGGQSARACYVDDAKCYARRVWREES